MTGKREKDMAGKKIRPACARKIWRDERYGRMDGGVRKIWREKRQQYGASERCDRVNHEHEREAEQYYHTPTR